MRVVEAFMVNAGKQAAYGTALPQCGERSQSIDTPRRAPREIAARWRERAGI
jgi:hypothetical protein